VASAADSGAEPPPTVFTPQVPSFPPQVVGLQLFVA
jgi:hypothetical protein